MERMAAGATSSLQQARDQAQRASEALDQERVTQAAASGTRAEQNFEELRNEFRRRASGRFSEEMRQMREAARELDQREQDLEPATERSRAAAAKGREQVAPRYGRAGEDGRRVEPAAAAAGGPARANAADDRGSRSKPSRSWPSGCTTPPATCRIKTSSGRWKRPSDRCATA